MGNSLSQESKTNILNAINTEKEKCTKYINMFVNSFTNLALNNLISNNKLNLSTSCKSTNNFNMAKCTSTNGDIVQNLTQPCVSDMMANIVSDTMWQQKYSTELKSIFAGRMENYTIQNNNALMQIIDAKLTLMLIDPNRDLDGAIKLLMNVIGISTETMMGTNITSGIITNITNQFNNIFSKRTYTERDITNLQNIINSNPVSINSIEDCKLTTAGLNTAVMTNCNNDDNIMVLNQTAAIQSLQTCSQGVINTIFENLLNIYRTNINMPTKEYKENFQTYTDPYKEQTRGATTMQTQRNIVYNVGGDPSFIGANANPVLYYYNKYKKTYITIIIILLLLVLGIILITSNNASTMHDSPGYQLTATPSMKTEM